MTHYTFLVIFLSSVTILQTQWKGKRIAFALSLMPRDKTFGKCLLNDSSIDTSEHTAHTFQRDWSLPGISFRKENVHLSGQILGHSGSPWNTHVALHYMWPVVLIFCGQGSPICAELLPTTRSPWGRPACARSSATSRCCRRCCLRHTRGPSLSTLSSGRTTTSWTWPAPPTSSVSGVGASAGRASWGAGLFRCSSCRGGGTPWLCAGRWYRALCSSCPGVLALSLSDLGPPLWSVLTL